MEENSFKDRLTEHLLRICTSEGYLGGTLLSSPDIDEAWVRYAPSYYGDAVYEFNGYPEFTLACAGFLGMAVAALWDRDWPRYREMPYSFFLGERGFDDMDDHIAADILKDRKWAPSALQSVSGAAYHYLMKEHPEAGTVEAYRLFLAACEVLFKIGAAIELHRLGYKYEKVDLVN